VPDLGLTSTEARIAGLVRDGASNREIATQLFLSVKTIEATLTRVYRKLGVRSRTQLSSRLVGLDPVGGTSARVLLDVLNAGDGPPHGGGDRRQPR
jgi:DNA-binding CsgD family transcriptional regulator